MGVFGVRGELRIHLHNRASTLLHGGGEVTLVSPSGERRVVQMTTRGGTAGRVLARIPDLTDRDVAESMIGWTIEGTAELLPPLQEGEFYQRDLVGLEVRQGDLVLGRLTVVHDHGTVDVWEVEDAEGEAHYVPALRARVLEVDLDGGFIRIAP